ncbi:MAG: T9SS type A sorting domain-containing protein [Ignavibacteriales bacterium]|nr:MAG: T9SS type A sorting domain-containing protein [Ignavibacteriales bacterium]
MFLDSLAAAIPADTGTDAYTEPAAEDEVNWKLAVKRVLESDFSSAHTSAGSFGYGIYQFTDTESQKIYYILAKTSGGINYWGYFAFNGSASRQKLIIQAPHSRYDFKTELQSNYVFWKSGARALFVAGIHRCNATGYSSCAGTTTVCQTSGLSEKFRKSDPAHNVNSTFQFTTYIVDSALTNSIFVQLHGFAYTPTDPDLIMSNGVTADPVTDYLSTLKSELLELNDTLDFKILHIDTTWNKLTGTTNVQGRMINGSLNPCGSSASVNSGRFLHIEQVYTNLRDNETSWDVMATAIINTFPEDPLPVELSQFQAAVSGFNANLYWRTETEVNNYGFEIERLQQERNDNGNAADDWRTIAFVPGYGNSNSAREYNFTDKELTAGTYLYRLKQIDTDGAYEYSHSLSVTIRESGFVLYGSYPNPFNASAVISYYLPEEEHLRIEIFDVLGRKQRDLVNAARGAGLHKESWDGTDNSGGLLPSGVYIYRLRTGEISVSGKLLMQK